MGRKGPGNAQAGKGKGQMMPQSRVRLEEKEREGSFAHSEGPKFQISLMVNP